MLEPCPEQQSSYSATIANIIDNDETIVTVVFLVASLFAQLLFDEP